MARARSRRISFTIHRNTHGTPARNGFLREVHVRQLFVAADIHGTDDNGLRATGLSHRFIGRKPFFSVGSASRSMNRNSGTRQTYAFGAVALSDLRHRERYRCWRRLQPDGRRG